MRHALIAAALIVATHVGVSPARAQGIFAGEVAGDDFGTGLAGVGDLNNDGFEDFAIGAPGQDDVGSDAGRVYIFLGRAQNIGPVADIVLSSGDGGDHFGFAVAGIGRFNNDAYDDMAVGSPDSDAGGSGRGRVHIYFGNSSGTSLTSGPILSGQQGGDQFGYALDGGFDFNDDGRSDLAVGSPERPTGGARAGEVRIYFGASSPTASGDVILTGEQSQDWFGVSVSRGGDINNDGFGDLVVGAPQPFQSNAGKAYVIFGRSDGQPPVRLTLGGEFGGDRFGWAVGGGGNLDNDAFDDVVVGAPKQDAGATQNGAAYVFRGGNPMNNVSDAKVAGRESGDEFGSSLSIRGDWDDDNRSDLIVGAPLSDDGGNQAGEINLFLGASPINAGSRGVYLGPRLLPGFAASDHFGTAVDFVDYNADGHSEVLAGSPRANQVSGDETGFASLTFSPGSLVPVRLLGMTLVPGGDRITLDWRVESDGALLGFHVERRSGEAWRRVNANLLFEPTGHYRFVDLDEDIEIGGNFAYRLVALGRGGLTDTFGPWTVAAGPGVRPFVDGAYPNPAPAGVTVPIVMPESALAVVTIFDSAGRQVRRLHNGTLLKGRTTLWWDGTSDDGTRVPAGSYWYRLETGRTAVSKKVVILR
ncbi:MAG TPA: FlgD immunoglobulin-like domain containing protein [Candidatus Eisenbacteria bacterium]